MYDLSNDKNQQRKEMLRIMHSREAIIENFDPFEMAKFPQPGQLIVDFTEKSNFQSDEIFLRRLQPNAQARSAMIMASSRYIITAFNYRFNLKLQFDLKLTSTLSIDWIFNIR